MSCPTTSDQTVQRLEPAERTEPATCPKHGAYQARILTIMPDAPPIRLGCPACSAIAQAEREADEARRKREDAEHALRVRVGRIGIPARFADRTLESYVAASDEQRRVLAIATGMATTDQPGRSLILCGKPGTGKTHLAVAIARRFAETGRTALFETVLSAIRRIKSTYHHASERTEVQAMADLLAPDLLILDEVGVQTGSEHEKMLVFEIINERYQQCRSTILISNLTREELTAYLGDRIIDRFREAGGVVAFDWDSWRGRRAA